MKIENHEQVVEAVEEILEQKNWTGLTLKELAIAGRVVPTSDLESWVRFYYAENDMVYGGFYAQMIVDCLKFEIERL